MVSLGESQNFSKTFENAAKSLTKWMRDAALQQQPFEGLMTQSIVVVKVHMEILGLAGYSNFGRSGVFLVIGLEDQTLENSTMERWCSCHSSLWRDEGVQGRLNNASNGEDIWVKARAATVKLEFSKDKAGMVMVES